MKQQSYGTTHLFGLLCQGSSTLYGTIQSSKERPVKGRNRYLLVCCVGTIIDVRKGGMGAQRRESPKTTNRLAYISNIGPSCAGSGDVPYNLSQSNSQLVLD